MKKYLVVLLTMLSPAFAVAGVASGSSAHNERFTVTVMNAHHVVMETLSGVTIASHPLHLSQTKRTRYVAQITSQKIGARVTTKAVMTTGDIFTLTPSKQDNVHITGYIYRFVRMNTKKVKDEDIHLPIVHASRFNENVHLTHGQSVTLPMGHGFVKVTRI